MSKEGAPDEVGGEIRVGKIGEHFGTAFIPPLPLKERNLLEATSSAFAIREIILHSESEATVAAVVYDCKYVKIEQGSEAITAQLVELQSDIEQALPDYRFVKGGVLGLARRAIASTTALG